MPVVLHRQSSQAARQRSSRSSISSLGAEDRGALYDASSVLPEQFFTTPTPSGEVALMRAVLEDAIECFQQQFENNSRRTQRLAQEAAVWLFSDDERWPFSFVNLCAALGIEPGYLRRGLRRWQKQFAAPPRLRHAA